MWKWFAGNWFKILIVIILGWFAYSYIQTQKINEYVECTKANTIDSFDNPNKYSFQEREMLTEICDSAITHKSGNLLLLPN
jgi:hypothetical protein